MQTAPTSVIIPVYNRAKAVIATLDAVAAQSVRPARLVIVDDASTDGTADSVRAWLAAHRQLDGRLICQPRGGAGSARNRGFSVVTDCPMVAFLDSDDCWPVDFLERTCSRLGSDPTAVAATCDRQYCYKTGLGEIENLASMAASPTRWFLDRGTGIGSGTVFRSDVVRKRGGFDVSLPTGQDAALFLRLSLDGKWLHVPGAPVVYDHSNDHGGEANLSRKYADAARRWAAIYEDFVVNGGGDTELEHREYCHILSAAWCRAGRELGRQRRYEEAEQCVRAALAWRPMMLKAWARLAAVRLGAWRHPEIQSGDVGERQTSIRLDRYRRTAPIALEHAEPRRKAA